MMLDRQQILFAYQLILGHEPESEAVIQLASRAEDIDVLALQLFATEEFRLRVATGSLSSGIQTALHREQAACERADLLQGQVAQLLEQIELVKTELAEAVGRTRFEEGQARQSRQQLLHLKDRLAAIETSTVWKLTWPIRAIGSRLPMRLRADFSRAARVVWWTVTLKLPQRLRERTQRQASLRLPLAPPDIRGAAAGVVAPKVIAEAEQPVVVIIDDRWPEPDRDSGSLDAINMIESFIAFGYKVIFAVQSTLIQDRKYVEGVNALGAHPLTEADAPNVRAFIESSAGAVTLFVLNRVGSGGQFLELIRYNCARAKIIFNTVDLHYVREARMARLNGDLDALAESERTRDREELLTARSDLTIVVSSVENEILEASVPGANVLTLPLARAIHPPVTPFYRRSGIGFIGGFAHQPNIDAVRYFLAEVWPLVREADSSIRFDIVGAGLPDGFLSGMDENVVYRGALDSLDSWFEGLRLTVAPLRVGAGAKGKVASSLCAGLPCVVSPVAAEGMGLEDGKQILIGRTAADMAAKILQLYADPNLWQVMSSEGLALAEKSYSLAAFRRRLRGGIIGMQLPAFAD